MRAAATLILPVGFVMVLACSRSGEHASSEDEAGDASLEGAPSETSTSEVCVLDAGSCGPSPYCCSPMTGWRVHLDAGCLEATRTALACRGTHPPSEGICVNNGEVGCYVRSGPEGKEFFRTPFTWTFRDSGDLEPCSDAIYRLVMSSDIRGDCPE